MTGDIMNLKSKLSSGLKKLGFQTAESDNGMQVSRKMMKKLRAEKRKKDKELKDYRRKLRKKKPELATNL